MKQVFCHEREKHLFHSTDAILEALVVDNHPPGQAFAVNRAHLEGFVVGRARHRRELVAARERHHKEEDRARHRVGEEEPEQDAQERHTDRSAHQARRSLRLRQEPA